MARKNLGKSEVRAIPPRTHPSRSTAPILALESPFLVR